MGRKIVALGTFLLIVIIGISSWLGYRYGRYVQSETLIAQANIPRTEIEALKSDMRMIRDKNTHLEKRVDELTTQKANLETTVQKISELEKKVEAQTLVPGSKYRIAKGDTLSEIAKKTYGEASWYQNIARVNHIHDPDYIIEGLWITLPSLMPTQNAAPES